LKPFESPTTAASSSHTSVRHLPQLLPRYQLVCLALITVVAAALRVFRLTSRGLYLDEGFSAYLGRTTLPDFVAIVWNSEFNMVAYYALLRAWMHLGHSEFIIRLLSVLMGAATVPAIYFVGRRLFSDPWTSLCASLLLAVHPFLLILSRSARSYSLVVLLVTLASLFFLRALQDPSWGNWIAYAVFSAAAVYSHFFAVLVILAHAVSLLFVPGRRLPWKYMMLGAVLLIALLIPVAVFLLHHRDSGNLSWVMPLNRQQVIEVLYSLTLSKRRSLTYLVAWIVSLGYAVALSRETAWPYRFTAIWLALPISVTLLVSVIRPVLVERFLAVCIPAGVLLAAAGIVIIAHWSRWIGVAILVLMVFYSVSNIRHYMRHPEYDENWREASAYLLSHAQTGDEVLIPQYPRVGVFDYYQERFTGKLPALLVSYSPDASLPTPAPQSVWFIGPVVTTENWGLASFRQAHQGVYCEAPPQPNWGSIRTWQFRRCNLETN
jgi:mannosyltransferase